MHIVSYFRLISDFVSEERTSGEKDQHCNGSLKRSRGVDSQEELVQHKRKKSKITVDSKSHATQSDETEIACDGNEVTVEVNDVCGAGDHKAGQKTKKHKKHKKKKSAADNEDEQLATADTLELDNVEPSESIHFVSIVGNQLVNQSPLSDFQDMNNFECAVKRKRRRRKHAKKNRKKEHDTHVSTSSCSADGTDICNESNVVDTVTGDSKLYSADTAVTTDVSVLTNKTAECQRESMHRETLSSKINLHQAKNAGKFRQSKNRRRRVIVPTLTYLQLASSCKSTNSTETQLSGQSEQSVTMVNQEKVECQSQPAVTSGIVTKNTCEMNDAVVKQRGKANQGNRQAGQKLL